ncbi:alkaline phosphatase [Bacillus glycinifermentans]|uniref:Alkaline phosphatase n=1 Tax=Bacillus glycinifermentans TaxID=1664069 RepID=A0A0J6EWJ5_9BACI|nr:alkaline phosphatase [Bacillus glycinifermentans]ATH92303.1 alkaline phosphatase [Bacillus glycinifermentans]KMM54396.1 alkaline phosphatase [Bacillus glycinifermentans]KRT95049.1 alkaline phosphatase [Bacillus glycinifermentans]MEC0484823.1 alkaline phosphatase [Bacillus glycinifermentans]MEC0495941.1 alkaline phosphatase [Bacillus glycinifermentans]
MGSLRNRITGIALAGAVALGSAGTGSAAMETAKKKEDRKVKNVIMMVMDGTSSTATTLARWYKGEPLALDKIVTGGVRTYSAESAITDSAPAGTAMATGHKSNSSYVGVLPSVVNSPGAEPISEKDHFRPLANVLEGAKQTGRATGIIATSEIQHATPASYSAHHLDRNNFEVLGEQQVYQNIDVVLGGGKESLQPGTKEKSRKDNEDLVNVIKDKKYDFVETKDELVRSKSKKIWGAFSQRDLAYDMDRNRTHPEQPTLAEMTKKSIQTLSKDKDGFFLFVEGSKPDWAAHQNDPIGIISDVLAFDHAVKEALKFAEKDKNTMVIAVSDHGNSGISIGNSNTTKGYDSTPVSAYIDPLKKAKMTLEGATGKLKDDLSNIEEAAQLYGLDNLTASEKEQLKGAKDKKAAASVFVKLLANRANLGFTTGGHTGEDVFLYSYGPQKPQGLLENTDIAKTMAKAMGFNLDRLTNDIFSEARQAFKKAGARVTVDKKDPANPVVIAERKNVKAEMPVNKNIIRIKGKEYELNSVIVESDGSFYVPKEAVRLFQKKAR